MIATYNEGLKIDGWEFFLRPYTQPHRYMSDMSEFERSPRLESNPSKVEIRRASFDDVAAIHRITQAAYTQYRTLIPYSSIWRETPDIIAAEMQLGPILLSVVDGEVVGSVRSHVEHEAEQEFIYVHRLAVLPSYRQRGLGRALMQAVEDLAKSENLHQVRLETRAAQPENYHFYRKLGYKLGEISLYLPDGSPRAYWMFKDLVRREQRVLVS